MLHACFYTICLLFRYTSWHFYAFSGTNLLTSCHSSSSLFSAVFVFQKWYTGNILGIGRNKFLKPYFTQKLPEIRRRVGGGATRAPHTGLARPGPRSRHPGVRAPGPSSDIAPSPIKTPRRKKPKYPITFPEHIAIRRRRRPEDREGPEALPGTLPERGIATGGLLHRHACL
jgi:hypothetical protein